MAPNDKKVKTTNGYRLPERLPKGEVLNGILGEKWEIGDVIGSGGFGVIYLARSLSSDRTDAGNSKSNARTAKSKTTSKFDYVIKLDHASGPLFAEMHFYSRVAKKALIEDWLKEKSLASIGIPEYISSGMYNHAATKTSKSKKPEDSKYRFLVMPKFGLDLQKVLDSRDLRLSIRTAYTIGIKVLQVLEYVHSFGYIHADIKASNLLLSAEIDDPFHSVHDQIWLVDYGLADRFILSGKHREYCEDKRKENNGTVEFLARDSHIGAFSRKNDLEILAYNILSWTSGGRLPWMSNLEDYNYVKESKKYYMDRLHELFNYAFQCPNTSCDSSPKENKKGTRPPKKATLKSSSNVDISKVSPNVPAGLVEFFQTVIKLDFTEQPNYTYFQEVLRDGIESSGQIYNATFDFHSDISSSRRSSRSTVKRPAEQLADFNIEPIPKISANGENGIAKSRLRRNGHLAPKNESERTSSLNGNQLQVLDTIRRKRTNAVSTDLQPVLRPKRKNTENQIEPLQQAALHLDDADLEPVKSGRAVRKTTRNLRSGSTKPAKEATETSIEILNGKVSGKSNDMVKEVNNVKKNPTPAMLEIMRKLNQKKKT